MKTVRRPPYPKWNPGYFPCSSLTPLPLSSRRPSVSFGGFGLKNKLAMAEGMGATHVIDASSEDSVARIQELTGGMGADYSFEVIGSPATIQQAFSSVHAGGTCVVIGVSPAGAEVTLPTSMISPERTLMGASFGGARQMADLPMLVDMYMDGKLKLDELISRTMPLEDINTAFDLLQKGEVARTVIVYGE